ncbi:MAG: hypothetical protein ACYC0O_09740 [Desulfurivibrionaceae bacterium]|jgi:hypothetical protein|nr:hypothetical protein [Pseudomonadota bacterium]MBU4411740.1 hypothetical protein [Pseudomonadota bacterium]MCG2823030.1 hypothetical protein [Desulfobulbaceae bacterium]MDP2004030.1 hypothetical protein [Desulfurivibrionaceae bacterium]MDP2758746.1 hypothetical protein [Desulfurivibrionaceae bacterium]
MSFSCKNYDYNDDKCLMLKQDCIPGRPGCVLEGRVILSEALAERIKELEQKKTSGKTGKKYPLP